MAGKHRRRSRTWRPDIAGLRALAVALVVAQHAGARGFDGGYIGVDVFFVLSGFLITGILISAIERDGRVGITGFYARRARRILPAAIIILLATILASDLWTNVLQAHSVQSDAPWVALFAANIHFSQLGTDYFSAAAPPSPLQHYWSLAVEEQFYVVIPALLGVIALLKPKRLRLTIGSVLGLVTVVSLVYSVLLTRSSPTAAYFSAFTRAWELAAGGVLATVAPVLHRRAQRKPEQSLAIAQVATVLGLIGIIVASTVYSPHTQFPGYAAALPVGATLVVIGAGTLSQQTWVARLLGVKPMRGLGAISYSLYLWHWPVLVLSQERASAPLSGLRTAGLVALSVVLASVTYALIERPWQKARILVRRPALSLGAGVVLLFGGWAVPTALAADADSAAAATPHVAVAAAAAAAPASVQSVETAVSQGARLVKLPTLRVPLLQVTKDRPAAYTDNCHVRIKGSTSPLCTYGDKQGTRTAVLYGDSHAAQWLPALSAAATRAHWKLILITKSGCPVASVPASWDYTDKVPYPDCDAFRKNAQNTVARIHPDLVITANLFQGIHGVNNLNAAHQQWAADLNYSMRVLKRRATKIVYLGDTPDPRGVPVQCLASHSSNITPCQSPASTSLEVVSGFKAQISDAITRAGATYVDTTPWLCTSTTCPAVINQTSVYVDDNHMSATYSAFLSGVLGRAVGMN